MQYLYLYVAVWASAKTAKLMAPFLFPFINFREVKKYE